MGVSFNPERDMPESLPDDFASDVLNGAAEIAAYTRQTIRQVNHQLEAGTLPGFMSIGAERVFDVR
jgi:hypothetical protein